MIYFINAYYSIDYPWAFPIHINMYEFPENNRTEVEVNAAVEEIIRQHKLAKGADIVVKSNSLLVFDRFRVAIKEGNLSADQFKIQYFGQDHKSVVFTLDADGRLTMPNPRGFFDAHIALLRRLL